MIGDILWRFVRRFDIVKEERPGAKRVDVQVQNSGTCGCNTGNYRE
jgi:hypothetical protein